MVNPVDLEFEEEINDRDRQVLLEKISKILEKIVQVLPNTANTNRSEKVFTCKNPPQVLMIDYLRRFLIYGQIPINILLAGLIFTDRALKTRLFSQKSVVHK